MIRVRIRSRNVYGWLGKEAPAFHWFILGDDRVNYISWPLADIETIGVFEEATHA